MSPIKPIQPQLQECNQVRRKRLRKQLRKLRRDLDDKAQVIAERGLIQHLGNNPALLNARKVASYIPVNGEISPRVLEQKLPRAIIYYPCITNFTRGEMRFYKSGKRRHKNAFNIPEPIPIGAPMPATHFDIILVPLVAFDRQGNRLGMGAGFYDRVLSFRLAQTHYKRPKIIGIAHHFQEVKSLVPQSWDVPLDAILTDVELITPI